MGHSFSLKNKQSKITSASKQEVIVNTMVSHQPNSHCLPDTILVQPHPLTVKPECGLILSNSVIIPSAAFQPQLHSVGKVCGPLQHYSSVSIPSRNEDNKKTCDLRPQTKCVLKKTWYVTICISCFPDSLPSFLPAIHSEMFFPRESLTI